MANKKLKPHTIRGHNVASRLAARAEVLLKANPDVGAEAYDRLDAIERETSYQQAGSKEAFLHHLGILARTGERLAEDQPEHEIDRLALMHTRLVQSLAVYAETVLGVDRDECGMMFYLGEAA